jgi:hypothetical protein
MNKNKMKNKLVIMAGAVVALVSFSASVQATPITGSIGFTGSYTQNGGTHGNLASATSMTISSSAIEAGTPTGSFVGASLLSFATPIAVNTLTPPIGQLWSVLVGSTTYDFNVTTESEPFANKTALDLQGDGIITDGNAADATTGTWQLNFGVSGESFTWQGTSAANVPDGGMTVMLLGGALAGFGLLKKKFLA